MIEGLQINRVLDLSLPSDQQELREAARNHPELLYLIEEYLAEYLSLFTEPDWHKIYSGGLLAVRVNPKHSTGINFLQGLRLTKTLKKLSVYKGYSNLLAGFRNPTQIESTYFESTVACWCVERKTSLSIEFSPKVTVKGGYKYPEFLWHTELGDLFCECKRGNFLEGKLHQRISRLQSYLNEVYERYKPWDSSLRLDVRCESGTTNKIQSRFKSVVAQASAALKGGTYQGKIFTEGNVSAVLQRRDEPFPQEREAMIVSMGEVGPVAKNLVEITYLTLTMSLAKYRQDAVARLLRDARTQLPPDATSAVFIELGGAGAAQQRLLSLLGEPNYENTPWVSIWSQGELAAAVWRNNQPFDDRILLGKD
jgi:hypothetical protein